MEDITSASTYSPQPGSTTRGAEVDDRGAVRIDPESELIS